MLGGAPDSVEIQSALDILVWARGSFGSVGWTHLLLFLSELPPGTKRCREWHAHVQHSSLGSFGQCETSVAPALQVGAVLIGASVPEIKSLPVPRLPH